MDHGALLDGTEDLSCGDSVPHFDYGGEIPFLRVIQSRRGDSAVDEVSHLLPEDGKGPLDSVVNGGEETGSELNGERLTGVCDRLPGFDSRGVLVNLDDGIVADDLDDLSHQLLVSNMHDVVHFGRDTGGSHHGSGDPVNYTFSAHLFIL